MKTMQDRARAVVNSVGFSESPEAAIAEALQVVADECADLMWLKQRAIRSGITDPEDAIRARFPRKPDAK